MPRGRSSDAVKQEDERGIRFTLTEGSEYRITSLGTKEVPIITVGRFVGHTLVGNIDALVIEMTPEPHKKGAGRSKKAAAGSVPKAGLRLVPTHMILTIDVISIKKKVAEKEDRTVTGFYM